MRVRAWRKACSVHAARQQRRPVSPANVGVLRPVFASEKTLIAPTCCPEEARGGFKSTSFRAMPPHVCATSYIGLRDRDHSLIQQVRLGAREELRGFTLRSALLVLT